MVASDGELARRAGRLRILRIEQLRAAGLSRGAIRHRVSQGRLRLLWPGVYLVGPGDPSPLSLAYGAAESYAGATYVTNGWGCFVHGFAKAPDPPVDLLIVTGSRARKDGILPHWTRNLQPHDVGYAGKIPPRPAASSAAPTPTA